MMFFALLLTAMPVLGVSSSLSGTWVPSSIKQALETGQATELPCWVQVETGGEPRVVEDCGGERQEWTDVAVAVQRAGTVEVEGRVPDGARRLVLRAGAPNELERIANPSDGGQRQMQRLYRLPPGSEPVLAGWSAAQRLLVHPFRTDDGAAVEFRADGTYRFAEEEGRYELQPWPLVEGASGLLLLESRERTQRRYWVVGEGERLGLAPAQQPWELEKLQRMQAEALERAAASGAVQPGAVDLEAAVQGVPRSADPHDLAPGGTGPGEAHDAAKPADHPDPLLLHAAARHEPAPSQDGAASQRKLDAIIERLVADVGEGERRAPGSSSGGNLAGQEAGADEALVKADPREAAPTETPAPPTAIFVVDAEAASIWLSRAEKPQEPPLPVPAGDVALGDELEGEEEIPAIARPISPQRKGCGCNAAEGVGILALLPLAGLLPGAPFWRRKDRGRHDQGEPQSPR